MSRRFHHALTGLVVLTLVVAGLPASLRSVTGAPREAPQDAPSGQIEPVTSHPRLWITADDLPRLRGWATDTNPLWRDGLALVAEEYRAEMDNGIVPGQDAGGYLWEEYPVENYSELFAFLSLVHPDAAVRDDYAQRARTVLMHGITEAAKGQAGSETPFRQPDFATNDRSRWWGEGWARTVDWIYPVLTAEDKAVIRQVFLRWAKEIQTGGYHRPGYDDESLIGVVNDPALLADRGAVRWAGNNYFTGNMRNLGLMAMALDPADDPGGELGAFLDIAIGAHLYMVDDLFRTDSAGGLAPEGFEYSPQSVGYVAQFLLALHTAGRDDPAVWGSQVDLGENPFWDALVPAYLHSLGPVPTVVPDVDYIGPLYQAAWYGDGLTYWAPDPIELFGALARYDELTGNAERLAAIRWLQAETAPGGPAALIPERVADTDTFHNVILYFMLYDPAAPAPTDPRPALPLLHYAPGLGRLLVRTAWTADATWFTYALGWNRVDHQHSDGNQFEFYRGGEWLTKGLVGYGASYGDGDPTDDYFFPSSEYHNTLAVENDAPLYNDPTSDRTHQIWLRGSQWEHEPLGDPTLLALSAAPGYVYALGDATDLYNSASQETVDVLHASRSLVWLAPDTIVVYDRAETETDGRFKRFWLNLPATATVDANRTTMTTESGQQLVVTTLLPTDAPPVVAPLDIRKEDMAIGEPMAFRLLVEAPSNPRETRFLHVLQGADAGAATGPVAAIASEDESFAGTVVGTTAVLFPVEIGTEVTDLRYTVPADVASHLITGLTPGRAYDLTTTTGADGIDIVVTEGTGDPANDAGVLLVGNLPDAVPGAAVAFSTTPTPKPAVTPVPTDESPTGTDETPASTPPPDDLATPMPEAPPVTEGGAATSGPGEIVYNVTDGHVYRVAAMAGAAPEDLSLALDTLSPAATPPAGPATPAATAGSPDDWITVAPDGGWLLLGTERFDPACVGWVCLALVNSDLTAGEAVRDGGDVIHPEGPGVVSADGALIVYPDDGGPHAIDLWAVSRQGEGWAAPVLLTGDSTRQYHGQPALSADGTRIAFDCGDESYAAAGTAICEVGTDGTGFRVVLTAEDAPAGLPTTGAVHQPLYTTDGGILFEADWTGDAIWRLAAGATTPEPVAVAFANDNDPCILSDGRIASLWLDRPAGKSLRELKVMTADGAAYVMLVTETDIEAIACGG